MKSLYTLFLTAAVIVFLSSSVMAQRVALYPDTLKFGKVPIGSFTDLQAIIVNVDTLPVVFDGGAINNRDYRLIGITPQEAMVPHYVLHPGDSITGIIEFTPSQTGASLGGFIFNLGDGTTHELALTGEGSESSMVKQTPADRLGLTLSPNPAAQVVTLNFSTQIFHSVDILILDEMGKLVKEIHHQQIPTGNSVSISLASLPNGSYELIAYSEKLAVAAQRLVLFR